MSAEKIRAALERIGEQDVLAWARRNATQSLFALNQALGAGVAPVELQRFMAEVARETGRYDQLMRTEAVRNLNQFFPEGYGRSKNQDFGLATAWSMWASLVGAAHKSQARQVWDRLEQTAAQHPDWVPRSPDDPLIAAAFAGSSFEPTAGERRLAEVERRVWQEAERENHPFSVERALANLGRLPPGYGYIYSLYILDGEVCNGGFRQLYDNGYGPAVPLAAEALRTIGREDLALLVEESARHARPLDELDQAYYDRTRERGWLEIALTDLVLARPDLF
ncbi:MAG: DMP19 family protein [Bacillota bacterium]